MVNRWLAVLSRLGAAVALVVLGIASPGARPFRGMGARQRHLRCRGALKDSNL